MSTITNELADMERPKDMNLAFLSAHVMQQLREGGDPLSILKGRELSLREKGCEDHNESRRLSLQCEMLGVMFLQQVATASESGS